MAEIAYFVHGRGRGHASRAATVLPRLRGLGHRVTVFAGGDALDLLDPAGIIPAEPLPPGLGAMRVFARRLPEAIHQLRERQIQLVLSDGDAPSVHAARRLHLPLISLGHDQVFLRCAVPPGLPRRALWSERAVGWATSRGARFAVAVHFLPIAPSQPGTWVARPDPPELPGPTPQSPATGPWVAYLRDGEGEDLLEAAARQGLAVRCFGRLRRPIPGVEARPFSRPEFLTALARAPAVLATAGSNLLAECIFLRIPIFAVYTPGDHEQRLNAHMAQEAGVALAAALPRAAAQLPAFCSRLAAGGFCSVDLTAALPPLSQALPEAIDAALNQPRSRPR